nr:PhzF family phenazine biosynthesis protein [Microbacterium halimionae]
MPESQPAVLRYAAFTAGGVGGNPAGIVFDAESLSDAAMQQIATDVDYAETAFISASRSAELTIRYFSPVAEVPFCGHATIATAVAMVERGLTAPGEVTCHTRVGDVVIQTTVADSRVRASFTSVPPSVAKFPSKSLQRVLEAIGLTESDLDERMPPAIPNAGSPHPTIVIADRAVFDSFTFDPRVVRSLMDAEGWPATITVLHAPEAGEVWARNIFPVGRITEDPATGSAAAATGAYLRAFGLVSPPATITIHQGEHVGRPSVLTVTIPPDGGITVAGMASEISE